MPRTRGRTLEEQGYACGGGGLDCENGTCCPGRYRCCDRGCCDEDGGAEPARACAPPACVPREGGSLFDVPDGG